MIEAENDEDLESWMEYLDEVGCLTHKPNSVFGATLESIQAVNSQGIPHVAIVCMEYVEKAGLDVVGIYRLSSTKSKVEELRTLLAAGRYDELQTVGSWDVHVVTCLLKQWLRELPNPVCPFEQYQSLVSMGTNGLKVSSCREVIGRMPRPHRVLLRALLEHLARVAERGDVNKMEASNLGSIFGPSVLRPLSDRDFRIDKQNAMLEFMIKHSKELFP